MFGTTNKINREKLKHSTTKLNRTETSAKECQNYIIASMALPIQRWGTLPEWNDSRVNKLNDVR